MNRGGQAPLDALPGLEALFDETPGVLAGLRDALVGLWGTGARLVGSERLESKVRRLRVETAGSERSVVVKQLDPVVGYRNRMLAERWLPAVGLDAFGPGLLACAGDPSGQRAWQVYEDFGDAGLDRTPDDVRRVLSAVRAVAELHVRFADHAVLGECRLWGGDLGRAFFAGNTRDALRALEALASNALELPPRVELARERLTAQLQQMLEEEDERGRALEQFAGPETLVHGDLWPMNIFVLGAGERLQVRLIDWDHVGVAHPTYDLSTLLIRFPSAQRPEILAEYAEAVAPLGWQLPDRETLNGLFDSEERARIASHIVWPALALLRKDAALRDWALAALEDVGQWFEQLTPVLGDPGCARG